MFVLTGECVSSRSVLNLDLSVFSVQLCVSLRLRVFSLVLWSGAGVFNLETVLFSRKLDVFLVYCWCV